MELETLNFYIASSILVIMFSALPYISCKFPDCEAGAVPALGRLYGLPCFVDETLLDKPSVCFKGGNHQDWVRISSDAYWRLAQAEVGDFRLRSAAVW